MEKFLKHNLLSISVFITGACVLIVEVVAVRILSPYYGNTIFTVSSVISVILAALSVGYYAGGKFADKHPGRHWFFGIILLSGLVILVSNFLGIIILPALSYSLSLTTGPLLSSLFLFFLPALLLGTLSPYAVKLQSVQFPKQGVGSVAGKIFFWSTLGSIIGSLLAGFVFIPHFGIYQIMVATGLTLFLLGFFPLLIFGIDKTRLFQSLFIILVLTALTLFALQLTRGNVVYGKDGIYEKITIYDGIFDGRPTRFFQQDRSGSGAMFLDSDNPTDLVYDYTKYYMLYKVFKPDVKKALVIGGGAYSIPKALLAELPNAKIDVSEIEPSLFGLAKEYFGVKDSSRLHNYTEDGRRLLRDSDKKYDFIFSDVYYSLFSIPAHFTTLEFFNIAKEKLNSNGVFVANLIGDLSRQQPSLIMAEIKTFKKIFPNSYFFAVESPKKTDTQNIIFVGYNGNKKIDLSAASLIQDIDPLIQSLRDKVINLDRFDLSPYPILTDNFSPVEYLTSKTLERSFGERTFMDGDEMLAIIDQQLRYGPRYPSAIGHKKVQDFLIAEMKELTQDVKTQTWQHVERGGQTYELKNIIASLYPMQTKRIIIATHYDGFKTAFKNSTNQTQPVPGANNSASGVAVMVELARRLSNSTATATPSAGIDFIFFDGEEGEVGQNGDFTNWKPLGSTYFVEHLNEIYGNNKPISGLVLDMVCYKDLRIFKEASSVKNAPAQTELFWNIAQKINGDIFQNKIGQEIQDDHTPLNYAGIPSVLLIDYDYPLYATSNDTLDKCSSKSLEAVSQAIWNYIYN